MDAEAVDAVEALRWLCQSPCSFSLREVQEHLCVRDTRLSDITEAFRESPDCVWSVDDEDGGERYIAKRTLYEWFVRLNLRLARIGFCALNERQLLWKMNSLRKDGAWGHPPREYVEFGQTRGLLTHLEGQDRYGFPVSAMMSFLSGASGETARQCLLDRTCDADVAPGFEQLISERLRSALENLGDSRERDVLVRRYGMLGLSAMTLEEIGQRLGVTRERVRQLEVRCWKRTQHPAFRRKMAPLLVMYVLNRRGSLVVSSSNIQPEIEFVCKCLGVPVWTFPSVGVRLMGEGVDSINLSKDLWSDLVNLEANVKGFVASLPLQLTKEDVAQIAMRFMPIVITRLTKTQKAYLALKEIGRPAHFSEIAEMYGDMFPGECAGEHAIHAALLQGRHGVVWIGSKGTFALEEWGYERPRATLMDTIAQIVAQKYESTGNPVPLIIIQAEIGKHRRVVNPSSLILGSYCNPKLESVGDSGFIPREETDAEAEEVAEEDLDRALREFEQKTGAR